MSTQIFSLAAHLAETTGAQRLAAQLAEPSGLTVLLLATAGIIAGRFLISGRD